MQRLLGISNSQIAVTVVLHLGTSLALVIFFFKDIIRLFRDIKSLFLIVVVSVITAGIGIGGRSFFESLFSSVRLVAVALACTGAILILTKRVSGYQRNKLNFKDALLLGLAQAAAIIPGISRSGVTIATLLFRKVDRETSFKFSFLASLPAIFGASLLEAKKINFALQLDMANFIAGFLASFLVGLLSLRLLKFILIKDRFYCFGYYCILFAAVIFLFVK